MENLTIKEISTFVENDKEKTRLIINDSSKDTEIIFEGNGKLQVAVEV